MQRTPECLARLRNLRRANTLAALQARKAWHQLTNAGFHVHAEQARELVRINLRAARFYRNEA